MHSFFRTAGLALAATLSFSVAAHAAMGTSVIPATADEGRITLLYPTATEPHPVRRGPFVVDVAVDAEPVRGNGRLVVLSHGSGGSAWVHSDLARALVDAGFVVAVPAHRGDTAGDAAHPGPDSWTIRPGEISRAIDAVGRDPRIAPLVDLRHVGIYGMSAGGHAALSLAGGRWSPASFARHCEQHIDDDFPACVGLATRLTGRSFDWLRKSVALLVIRLRFSDETVRVDDDPRVAAIVAAVPFAADFDPASLAHPRMPLAFVTARGDRWLNPRYHADRVLAACETCERLVDLKAGGHGALLSPLPTGFTELEGDLLNDPPGFDRGAATAEVDRRVVDFFVRTLP